MKSLNVTLLSLIALTPAVAIGQVSRLAKLEHPNVDVTVNGLIDLHENLVGVGGINRARGGSVTSVFSFDGELVATGDAPFSTMSDTHIWRSDAAYRPEGSRFSVGKVSVYDRDSYDLAFELFDPEDAEAGRFGFRMISEDDYVAVRNLGRYVAVYDGSNGDLVSFFDGGVLGSIGAMDFNSTSLALGTASGVTIASIPSEDILGSIAPPEGVRFSDHLQLTSDRVYVTSDAAEVFAYDHNGALLGSVPQPPGTTFLNGLAAADEFFAVAWGDLGSLTSKVYVYDALSLQEISSVTIEGGNTSWGTGNRFWANNDVFVVGNASLDLSPSQVLLYSVSVPESSVTNHFVILFIGVALLGNIRRSRFPSLHTAGQSEL